jgi:hypothetical protein
VDSPQWSIQGSRLFTDPAPARAAGEAERCAALIEAFDELVVTDFDRRLLAVEDFELAEARGLRRQAEADCAASRYRFGLDAIEEAFWTIGIPHPAKRADRHPRGEREG